MSNNGHDSTVSLNGSEDGYMVIGLGLYETMVMMVVARKGVVWMHW